MCKLYKIFACIDVVACMCRHVLAYRIPTYAVLDERELKQERR